MNTLASPFKLPLIAILRGIHPHEAMEHIGILVDAGFDAIEVPLNSPDWERSIGPAVRVFNRLAWIGAGTVLREAQVDTLAELGAKLIVTPNTQPAVINHAVSLGLTVAAGFATATEAFTAIDAGAQMLKLFPANTFGPGYVRALRAVLPTVPLFAVGGITPPNLAEFLAAGCTGAGIGGELYQPGQPGSRTRERALAFKQAYWEAIS